MVFLLPSVFFIPSLSFYFRFLPTSVFRPPSRPFVDATKISFGRGALIRRGQAPHDGAAGGLFFVVATTAAGGTILLCGSEEWNRTRTSSPLRPLQAELFSAASIRKSWPEIRNRCTQKDVSRVNLASIPKFTPSNKESLHARGVNGQ